MTTTMTPTKEVTPMSMIIYASDDDGGDDDGGDGRDDVRSTVEVFDCATCRRMSSYIDPT